MSKQFSFIILVLRHSERKIFFVSYFEQWSEVLHHWVVLNLKYYNTMSFLHTCVSMHVPFQQSGAHCTINLQGVMLCCIDHGPVSCWKYILKSSPIGSHQEDQTGVHMNQ